jgi:predicted transcriptional regulator
MNRTVSFKKIAQANARILENQANISISNTNVQTVEQEQNQNHLQTQVVNQISVSHDDSFNLDSGDLCTKIKRNIKPKTIINSEPYNYQRIGIILGRTG